MQGPDVSRGSDGWPARLALVALGLILAVLVSELALQAGAQILRLTRGEPAAFGSHAARRILCLGDSNTYGIRLDDRDRESYPARLEALWNERFPGSAIEVLNAGVPGTNSSDLRRVLGGMLDALEPNLVIVMVGANDFWSVPEPLGEAEGGEGAAGLVRRHSRLLRLYRLLLRRFDPVELEVVRPGGGESVDSGLVRFGDREFVLGRRPGPELREQKREQAGGDERSLRAGMSRALRANLGALVARARHRGVPLVLMTYPSSRRAYGVANSEIRAAASRFGALLVELDTVFRPLCPAEACPRWLYPDQHPRAPGYRVVAETLLDALPKVDR